MTMPPRWIRPCAPGDEAALSLVGQATFLEAFAGVVSGKDILAHCIRQHAPEKYAAWLRDPASRVWLAEVEPGQAPVGYLVLTTPDLPLPDLGPQDNEIKRVYILHRFQGQGIGAQLMGEAQAHALANGSKRLLLGVYSGNAAAIGFYERLGYRKIGRRSFKVGENTYEDFILGLRIAD
ncbi:MAG TPA: GNAT family N-acetyltransferase [Opitutaceae bacterium]|nr:GNAT family N-acetyltransferase [Opitutaceae bacterium]